MDLLERYRAPVVSALAEVVPSEGPLRTLVGYPLGAVGEDGAPRPGIGGKLLRPSLVCLGCEALGGEVDRALPLAAAVELVHTFSLVHDDIVDGDRLRRGRPTAWAVFGKDQALHAGDALLALAFRVAAEAALPQAVAGLAQATVAMVEGQVRDLEMEGRRVTVGAYLGMVRGKTGALLGCSLELGALAAGRADLAPAHRRVGETLGIAFQVRDDWLGIWGDPAHLGKPVGGDLARGKRSFPVVWGLERDPSLGELLDQGRWEEARDRLAALGAKEATAAEAERLLAEAESGARALPWAAWAQGAFADLCRGLASRVT